VRASKTGKGFIRIRFIPSSDSGLKCIIEDDGVGRMFSTGRSDNHKSEVSVSWLKGCRLQVNSGKPIIRLKSMICTRADSEPGTRVEVDIPVIKS